jgi:citrate synthase
MSGDREYKLLKRALQTANDYKGLQPNFALATLFADMKFRSAKKSRTQNADFSETPFIVGRTAGWIAHAIEQYSLGETGRRTVNYRGLLPAPA